MTVIAKASVWSLSITILNASQAVIGGPYDYSNAHLDVELTFPEIATRNTPNTWAAWTATATLQDGIVAFSLDNRDTAASPTGASLLAKGNRVDLQLGGQRFWPYLYIIDTPDPITLGNQPIQLQLGDISQLSNLQTPEDSTPHITLGNSTAPHTLINSIATKAGLPTSGDTISTGWNISVPVQKTDTRPWPDQIGEIAACNGYFAWLDSTESLRLTPIDFNQSAPVIELTIGQDEVGINGWEPRNFDERPPGELTVIGGGGLAKERENPRIITRTVLVNEGQPDEYTSLSSTETTEIDTQLGAPQTTISYVESQAELQIRPRIATTGSSGGLTTVTALSNNTSTSLRSAQTKNVTHRFNGITGVLTSTTSTGRKARGLAGGDAYREVEGNSALTLIDDEANFTTEYEYDNVTNLVKKITHTERRPYCLFGFNSAFPSFYEPNRFLERDYLTRTTTWTQRLSVTGDPQLETWEIDQITRRPRGIVFPDYVGSNPETLVVDPDPNETFTIRASDGSTAPPETIYQESLYEQDDTLFEGTVQITPLAGNAFKQPPKFLKINAPVIVSDQQCASLAETFANWQHGLSLGYSFVGAVPSELFSSFSPGMRIDVTIDSVTSAYFLNGFSIIGNTEETLWGCNLGLIGEVGVTPDVISPPTSIAFIANNDEDLPAIEDNPVASSVGNPVTNIEDLPEINDEPVVTEGNATVSNAESVPAIQDNPVATSTAPTPVSNAEDLPAIQDNPVAVDNSPIPISNAEDLPAIQDNPSVAEATTNTENLPAIQDNPVAVDANATGLTAIASGVFIDDGTTITELFLDGVNTGGIAREATGRWLVTLATPMSSADFIASASADPSSGASINYSHGAQSITSTTLRVWREASSGAGANANIQKVSFAVWG